MEHDIIDFFKKKSQYQLITTDIENEFQQSPTNNSQFTILNITRIFLIAEKATQNNNRSTWFCEENLLKRRNAYEYDKNLQSMLAFMSQIGRYSTQVIPCGPSGMYRTELVSDLGHYLHFAQSFDPKAKYLQDYLCMNDVAGQEKYAYFYYILNNSKNQIVTLKLVLPKKSEKPNRYLFWDLTKYIHQLRGNDEIICLEPEHALQKIKNYYLS